MSVFGNKIINIVRNTDNLVGLANICEQAYCQKARCPYVPISKDDHVKIAQNYAYLQAVITFLCIIPLVTHENHLVVLVRIISGALNKTEKETLLRIANGTWGAGQPFCTDKGPLGRVANLNFFDDLPADVVEKDEMVYIAADWLAHKIFS